MDLILLRNFAYGAGRFVDPEDGSYRDFNDVLQPDGRLTAGVQDAHGLVDVTPIRRT